MADSRAAGTSSEVAFSVTKTLSATGSYAAQASHIAAETGKRFREWMVGAGKSSPMASRRASSQGGDRGDEGRGDGGRQRSHQERDAHLSDVEAASHG